MKKFFISLLITVFFSQNSYSSDAHINLFNLWLAENGFKQNVQEVDLCKKKKINKEIKEVCKNYPGGRWAFENNLNIKFYDSAELPEKTADKQSRLKANDDTLTYYLWRYLNKNWNSHIKYSDIKASKNPYKFTFDLREDAYVKEQMQETALLSYLLYENRKIVIDEITPKEKFLGMFKNDTRFQSQSNGKSIAAYIMGHAICKQYIESVDVQLNDWPLLENTLYYDVKLIDLLNMNAGDQLYVKSNTFLKSKTKVAITHPTLKMAMNDYLKNSKKSKNEFNYNGLPPHIVLNYIIFKIGDEKYKELLNEIFTYKVRMEHNSFHPATESASDLDKSTSSTMLATRYDYLRIAKAMLDDWKNDTCEGKFLKDIYDRRIKKTDFYVTDRKDHPSLYGTTEYAGFFHTGYVGIKDKPVLGMDGYGGQSILIDFENERIVSVMAVHLNYDWKKIVFEKIKEGFN